MAVVRREGELKWFYLLRNKKIRRDPLVRSARAADTSSRWHRFEKFVDVLDEFPTWGLGDVPVPGQCRRGPIG